MTEVMLDRRDAAQARDDIRAFIMASGELPTPRGVALDLMRVTRDPDVGLADVARLVKMDPALTAFVIRAANAARFAGKRKVADVPQAVTRLGINMVRVYAIAVSMMHSYRQGQCAGFDYDGFWARSLFAGIVMSELAERGGGLHGEEAFALGLLCQIGQLTFATAIPDDYGLLLQRARERGVDLAVLERDALGFDQNELTAVLLVEWGIPTKLADVVFWQQDPEAGGYPCNSLEHRLASQLQLAVKLADVCMVADGSAEAEVPALVLRAEIAGLGKEELVELSAIAAHEWQAWSPDLAMRGTRPRPLMAD